MMKGLPLAYNKDMQEDKEPVFDAVDTLKGCLIVFIPMLQTLHVRAERMQDDLSAGFINATDMADYLVGKGLPFREAHAVAGTLVRRAEQAGKTLEELPLDELRKESPLFAEDIYAAISLIGCMKKRSSIGGPAPQAVEAELVELRHWLAAVDAASEQQ